MKIEKQAFLSAMKKCLPGVEKGTSLIEGADTFVLSNNAIHSYNDNISVSVAFKFEEGLDGAVKSMDFFKLIGKMPGDEIEIQSVEKEFKVIAGSAEAVMNKVENKITEFISTLNIGELKWKELPANFFDAVRLCLLSNNNCPQRGIFVKEDKMVSTDIARINFHQLPAAMDQFLIDDSAIIELLKIEGLTHYSIGEIWAHFKGEDGTIFSCKRKDDTSYPIQKIMEYIENYKDKLEDDIEGELPKGLFNVADRVSTLSGEIDGLPAIKVIIKKDSMEFSAERYAGRIKEKLQLEKPFEKDVDITLLMDPFFLMEASKKVSQFYIRSTKIEGGTNNIIVFFNENYRQISSTFSEEEKQ